LFNYVKVAQRPKGETIMKENKTITSTFFTFQYSEENIPQIQYTVEVEILTVGNELPKIGGYAVIDETNHYTILDLDKETLEDAYQVWLDTQ